MSWLGILLWWWLVEGRAGLTNHCQVASSRQLTSTDMKTRLRNHFNLMKLTGSVYQELRMLTNLKYHDYGEDTEYFCCQSVGDCFLISPATDWTEPSVPGLTRLESTGLIHDVTLLTLDLRPRPAPSSTETPPAGGSTDPPDTEAPVEKKKRGTGDNCEKIHKA